MLFSDIWNPLFFWFSAQPSYFVQQLFNWVSPRDPPVISFSSSLHKSPLAAAIDFCSVCSLELPGITFMMLIIAILFCKVEIPFIIYVFCLSEQPHVFIRLCSHSDFAFDDILALVQENGKIVWLWLDFCVFLKTFMNWRLQEWIQLQLISKEDWIQLPNSGWSRSDVLGREHKHQFAFRDAGTLLSVFKALVLPRQNVLRNEPLQVYLCKINKKNVLQNQISYNFVPFFPPYLLAFIFFWWNT